jgi:hypothetical protein
MNLNSFTGLLLQADAASTGLLFRSDKIYAVLGVMLIVWGAVLFSLIRIDLKLKKLEEKKASDSK